MAGRQDERRTRRDIEHLLHLVRQKVDVIEQDQCSCVLKTAPNLGLGRFADPIALAERVKQELPQIARGLVAHCEIDDAVDERIGSRVIRELPKKGRFAYARSAADLDRKVGLERRECRTELRPSVQHAANRSGSIENRDGPALEFGSVIARDFLDDPATRSAHVQEIATGHDFAGNGSGQRGRRGRGLGLSGRNLQAGIRCFEIQPGDHPRQIRCRSGRCST